MKTLLYQDISELSLPSSIKTSLTDNFEFSHVQEIGDALYFILNYPQDDNLLHVICLAYDPLEGYTVYAQKDSIQTFSSIETVNELITNILNHYKNLTNRINENIIDYENKIELLIDKKYIFRLYEDKKDIINYKSALESLTEVIETIYDIKPHVVLDEKYEGLYSTILIDVNQLYKKMDVAMQTIDSIQNISESMHANKLTDTMRYLKLITLLFSIPGFITTIYNTKILPQYMMDKMLPFLILSYLSLATFTIYQIFKD